MTPLSRRDSIRIALVSIVLLIPCFWQSRIQAGDLSSHVYNAWLTREVQRGAVSDFWISHQHTNIALDVLLNWLLHFTNINAAQRIAVSLFVLVFSWGAFAFISTVARRRAWEIMFIIPFLSYGFVFHLGLMNFYFSTGVCLFFLAIIWNRSARRAALVLPLLALAWFGHPMPVLWALSLFLYRLALANLKLNSVFLLGSSLLGLILVHLVIRHRLPNSWSPSQLAFVTGWDQVLLRGNRYGAIFAAIIAVSAWTFKTHRDSYTWRFISTDVIAQFWIATALATFLVPRSILYSPNRAPATYLTERLSLFCAVLFCIHIGKTRVPRRIQIVLAFTAALFFTFVYLDARRLNIQEDKLSDAVRSLPSMQRVIFVSDENTTRLAEDEHAIDRVCVGHCYSYANYEPGSGHFRLRTGANNPFVLTEYRDLQDVRLGKYIVLARDQPLYQIVRDGQAPNQYRAIALKPGMPVRSVPTLP